MVLATEGNQQPAAAHSHGQPLSLSPNLSSRCVLLLLQTFGQSDGTNRCETTARKMHLSIRCKDSWFKCVFCCLDFLSSFFSSFLLSVFICFILSAVSASSCQDFPSLTGGKDIHNVINLIGHEFQVNNFGEFISPLLSQSRFLPQTRTWMI